VLLNKNQIRAKGLIKGASDEHFRHASYDLRIGRIINHGGQEISETSVEPQGMVRVISSERVNLSPQVQGYAMVKTGLCDEGILAINIGIIDPGYSGFLSTTLINFGRSPYPLRVGDSFLRVTFHEIAAIEGLPLPAPVAEKDYVAAKKKLVLRDFSPTFLNIDATATRAAERVVGGWKAKVLLFVSAFALLFTAGAALATTWSALTTTRTYIKSDQEQLKTEVKDLQEAVRKLQSAPAQSAPPTKDRSASK